MDYTTAAWAAVLTLADRQGGLITRADLDQAGIARRTVQRRVQQGLLRRVGRGFYVLPGTQMDLRLATIIAQRQLPSAIATGPSALLLRGQADVLGIDLGQVPHFIFEHTTRQPVRVLSHPGVRASLINGYPVAEVEDAVIDVIRLWPAELAERAAYRAAQQGIHTAESVAAAATRLHNHLGVGRLRVIARDLATGAHSRAERDYFRLLKAGRVTGWQPNYPVWIGGRKYVLDAAFKAEKLFVEVDGRRYHSDADQFQRDRTRQNALVLAGWIPMRFTWADIKTRPQWVLCVVRQQLAARRSAA